MFAVSKDKFTWEQGETLVTHYTADTGFHGAFCSVCGSPLPKTRWEKLYLVPAGTLNDNPSFEQTIHLHVSSKAEWDEINDDYPKHNGDLPAAN